MAAGFAVACGVLFTREAAQREQNAAIAGKLSAAETARAVLAAELADSKQTILKMEAASEQLQQRERFLAREARAAMDQNLELRAAIESLRGRDTLAQMRIATLSAKLASFATAGVTIVWDQEKQRGVIQIANLPKLAAGKDYQLWVIDPKYPIPVNGGVIRAGDGKIERVFFRPDQQVERAVQFAITIERTGGVPKAEGPLVFAGS